MNRYPVTLRFNLAEQQKLLTLCKFWNLDRKAVIKLAIEQFTLGTIELENKLKEKDNETTQNNTGGTKHSATDVGDDSSTPADTSSVSSFTANADVDTLGAGHPAGAPDSGSSEY